MRKSWDTYFMELADMVATRATCPRRSVGAVIVDPQNRVVATGYNGSPRLAPHCDDVGCILANVDGRERCIRTLHAESNALDQAGTRARCGSMYITCWPCYECAKRIVNAGIMAVYVGADGRQQEIVYQLFNEAGIRIIPR